MGQKPRFINIGFLRFRRFSSHVALHAFLSLLRRRAFRFDKESIPYITLSSQTSVPPAIPLSGLIAQKKEAAASAVFCKNNRLRLVTLFQILSPVHFVYNAVCCFCIADSNGRLWPALLQDLWQSCNSETFHDYLFWCCDRPVIIAVTILWQELFSEYYHI